MPSTSLPTITVVTPSFNQARYLEKTIRSILDQAYPALEYIIVDGGSTDGSAAIISRYSHKLHWWCSEPDDGQADALAKGFERSSGEILCWLNSDDILLPGALATVGSYFRDHSSVESATGWAYCIDADDRPVRGLLRPSFTHGVAATEKRFIFYGQDGVYQPATFWRRDAYFAAGGINTQFRFAMDLDLFTRLAHRRPFGIIDKYLACFRLHADAKSANLQDIRSTDVSFIRSNNAYSRTSPFYRFLLYWRFRAPSLLRKLVLQARLISGLETFPPADV